MNNGHAILAAALAKVKELESMLAMANAALVRSIEAERATRERLYSLAIQLGKTRDAIPTFADAQIGEQIN